MALQLPDLDFTTREHMLHEFDLEQAQPEHFVPTRLTAHGRDVWPEFVRKAITSGNDDTLLRVLVNEAAMFNQSENYERDGIVRSRKINSYQAAEQLALNEFSTWYARGFSRRLLAENVSSVQVYRAAEPKRRLAGCGAREGVIVPVQKIYDGHRAAYWPAKNPGAFSVPFQVGCHHSIRRVPADGSLRDSMAEGR